MKLFSKTFYRALDAVLDIEPSDYLPPRFGMGQPVWHHGGDQRAYIVLRYTEPGFMEIVRENDLTGPVELAHESSFVDRPPAIRLHQDRPGILYFTGTGRAVKAIDGGRL